MKEVRVLNYNRQMLRTINDMNVTWCAVLDICRILGFRRVQDIVRKMHGKNCKVFEVKHPNTFGAMKLTFVNPQGLQKMISFSEKPEAEDFKRWAEYGEFPDVGKIEESVENTPVMSVQATLQKAQMLIRLAEHKAVPQDEQLRLLSLAAEELTGVGFNTGNIVEPIITTEHSTEPDIMSLPEVFGYIREKVTKQVDGCFVDFYPAKLLVKRMARRNCHFDGAKAFNDSANENNFKTPYHGIWEKVTTPNGDAREFLYLDGLLTDFIARREAAAQNISSQ